MRPGDFRKKWAQMDFEVETGLVWNWRDRNALPVNQKDGKKAGLVIFPKWTVLVAGEMEIVSPSLLYRVVTDGVFWTWGNNDPPFGTVRVDREMEL